MPIYSYKCENEHETVVFKKKYLKRPRQRIRCKECGLWAHRNYTNKTRNRIIHLDEKTEPISHLFKKKANYRGTVIEALTPEPVFVRSQEQYQKLLRDTDSREKPR